MSPQCCNAILCPVCKACPTHTCLCRRSRLTYPPQKRPRTTPPLPSPAFLVPPVVPSPQIPHPPPPFPLPSSNPSCLVSTNTRPPPTPSQAADRQTLRELLHILRLDPTLANAPFPASSSARFDPTLPEHQPVLTTLRAVLHATATLLCPHDPAAIAAAVAQPVVPPLSGIQGEMPSDVSVVQKRLVENVVSAMKATKRGTLARRYFRCLLSGDAMSRADVNDVLGHPPEPIEQNVSVNTFGPVMTQSRSTGSTTWLGRRGSAGAVEQQDADDDNDDDDEEEDDDARIARFGPAAFPRMSSKTFSRSKRDWKTLMEYGELQPAKFGRARVQDDSLRTLLSFLFAPENISIVSWTRQRIIAQGRTLELPAVLCSKKGGVLHDEYCKLVLKTGKKPLSRGSFYAVAKALTRRDVARVPNVDTMTLTLVKDPLTLLRDLIMRGIAYPHRVDFLKQVDRVEWFLTHSFVESHIGKDSSGSHDLKFALLCNTLQSSPRQMCDRPVHCPGFQCPFVLLDQIHAAAGITENSPDAQTLANSREQFLAYLRFLCSKAAQDRAIDNTFQEIVSRRLRNRIVIFMNHVNYADLVPDAKNHPASPSLDTCTMHGSAVFGLSAADPPESDFEALFYNHIVCNDTQKDVRVVAFALEALFNQIREDLPLANEIVFVSDNVPSYKNHILPSVLPLIARNAGFQIVRYIYSCSQVCQFLIDAQFGVVSRFIPADVLNLEQVVLGINTQQTLPSMSAELIILGPEFHSFANAIKIGSGMFPSIGDKNDVVYQEWKATEGHSQGDVGKLSVIARLYDYAGIGKGYSLEIKESLLNTLRAHGEHDHTGNAPGQTHYMGTITGVRVTMPARRLQPMREWKMSAKDEITGGVVADTLRELHAVSKSELQQDKGVATESQATSLVTNPTTGPSCTSCRHSFKNASCLKSHACKGPPIEKDVSARAAVVVSEMLRDGKLPVFRDASEQLSPRTLNFRGPGKYAVRNLVFGWARHMGRRRAPMAERLTETPAVVQYRKEVFALLDELVDGRDMDATLVNRTLQSNHPDKSDIPSEKRLQYWEQLYKAGKNIERFYMIGKDGIPIVSYEDDAQHATSGRTRMNPLYSKKITDMHEQYLKVPELKRPKPRYMYKEFVNFFRDGQGHLPPDFPEQKQVMNKINALRTKCKQH